MKKVLAVLAATTMVGMSVLADGTVYLNSFDSGNPIFYLNANTAADGADMFVQILANGTPIASTNPGNPTAFNLSGGNFDAGYGVIPGVTTTDNVNFTIQAWKGASFATATETATATWTQKVADSPAAPTPPNPASLNNPAGLIIGPSAVVPEPTTIALGMLGAAALLIRRRK
jgi:hypothetical protein